MDGLALSISVGLQYGVSLKAIVDELRNTRFGPSGFTENPAIRYQVPYWITSRAGSAVNSSHRNISNPGLL